jgi:hypothetical protein
MKKATSNNNLAILFPEIAKQWHPILNGDLKPEQFLYGSKRKAWWQCSISKNHVWKAVIHTRTGKSKCGCPFCVGLKICIDNCLSTRFPNVAKEWNYIKNGEILPDQVAPFSCKKYWWICSICNYEWKESPSNRCQGTGCRECRKIYLRKLFSKENGPNWQGGISNDPYPSIFNNELKLKIRTRDNFTCQLCGITEEEHRKKTGKSQAVNHIDFNKENCNLDNLNTLCILCNIIINNNREYYTWYFQTKMKYKKLWSKNG